MFFILSLIIFVLNSFTNCYPYFPECSSSLINNKNTTVLETLNGKVKGTCYNVTVNYGSKPKSSNQVLTWLGIPYAEPPINDLRFRKPIPIKSWNQTLDGSIWPNKCVQISSSFDRSKRSFGIFGSEKSHKIFSSEDCLYLNVFVPYDVYVKSVIEGDSKYRAPILLYIHGGAFLIGSPADDRTEPSTLIAASNIIVVSINYRLGAFGFLHIKNTEATGNQGILDQHLALKWVYENANRFGGDKTRITIAGQSAGSWSVGYHLMYRPSWPYFRNAILESGTPLQTTFKLVTSDEATDRAILLGKGLGCLNENETAVSVNNQKLYECLQKANPNRIGTVTLFSFLKLFNYSQLAYQKFVSVFPLVIDGIEFTELARQAFESGNFKRCNILAGVTTKETSDLVIISSYFGSNLMEYEAKANLNYTYFRLLLEDYFSYYPGFSQDSKSIDKLIELYVPYYELLDETTNYYSHFIQITTDQLFRCPTIHLAEIYSKANMNAFVYLYGYRISTTPYPKIYGSVHSDELAMVFAEPLSIKTPPLINANPWSATQTNYSADERLIAEKIVKYWTSFIKDDRPSEWDAFNYSNEILNSKYRNIQYLNGNQSRKMIYQISNDKACKFWQDILNIKV